MKKVENEGKLTNALPVSINVGDVKMVPLVPYGTVIMRIFE